MFPKVSIRSVATWLGLLLMAVCFARLITMPLPSRSGSTPSAPKNSPVTVVLDPGHGGHDSGSIVGSILEKDLTSMWPSGSIDYFGQRHRDLDDAK
jgi:hypothetical protein